MSTSIQAIRTSFAALIAVMICLLQGACGGAALDSYAGGAEAEAGLPEPAALAGLKGGSAQKSLTGAQFIAQSRCFTEADSLRLNVSIEAVERNGSELGWASYRFENISGLPQKLTINSELPLAGSRYFVAVASFADLRWQWFGPFDGEAAEIDLQQVQRAVSDEGNLLFAVLARGHNVVLHHSSTLTYASPEV